MEDKVEHFYKLTMSDDPEDGVSMLHESETSRISDWVKDNLDLGDKWTLEFIKGVKKPDPTGHYEYIVAEVK